MNWKKRIRQRILDLGLMMMDLSEIIRANIYLKQKKVKFEGFWWWILEDLYQINYDLSDLWNRFCLFMIRKCH